MISFWIFWLCPARLVRLTWVVWDVVGKSSYRSFLWGLASKNNSRRHAASYSFKSLSIFFSLYLVSVHRVHRYSSMDTAATWKKSCFISSDIYVWIFFQKTKTKTNIGHIRIINFHPVKSIDINQCFKKFNRT